MEWLLLVIAVSGGRYGDAAVTDFHAVRYQDERSCNEAKEKEKKGRAICIKVAPTR